MPSSLAASASEVGVSALTELEVEAIEMFINFLRLIGLPKSVGEIYGLLFVAPRPMAMDEIMTRLGISLGAASQGLRLLRSFGAVKVAYVPGNRRDHYVADLDLSNFAAVFLKEELRPRMNRALERIKRMEEGTLRRHDPPGTQVRSRKNRAAEALVGKRPENDPLDFEFSRALSPPVLRAA